MEYSITSFLRTVNMEFERNDDKVGGKIKKYKAIPFKFLWKNSRGVKMCCINI